MTTELAQIRHPLTEAQAADITRSWRDLQQRPIQSQTQADTILTEAKRLRVPATRQWTSGRVATLLSQYFASSVPSEVMQAIAEDWICELKDFPAWALQDACRWWIGSNNPDRRKRPLPGDIADRARKSLGVVKFAEGEAVRFRPRGAEQDKPIDPPMTADQRAEFEATLAGFTSGRGMT